MVEGTTIAEFTGGDKDGLAEILAMELIDADRAAFDADEYRERMLIRTAEHVNSARVQCLLYRFYVAKAIMDAKAHKPHCDRTYTFVVDYGQNMELPVYFDEQPGCTYYYSPLGVYVLGVVNHVHKYGHGVFKEHIHAYVYHEGVA